jgi:hypothetical protein
MKYADNQLVVSMKLRLPAPLRSSRLKYSIAAAQLFLQ